MLSTKDIRDLVQRNMFYVLVVFCVQDQTVGWVSYPLPWKMQTAGKFNASVDVA